MNARILWSGDSRLSAAFAIAGAGGELANKTHSFAASIEQSRVRSSEFVASCAVRLQAVVSEHAALARRILQVVFRGSKEQMVWADAERRIAAMAHIKFWRKWTIRHLVGCSMRARLLSIESNRSVPISDARAFPEPTRLSLSDVFPETHFQAQRVIET